MSTLERIQSWFSSHCNGSWEHDFGIKIETIDNPGWAVEIDLPPINGVEKPLEHLTDRTASHWVRCTVSNGKIDGFCGPESLDELLEIIMEWLDRR